MGFFFPLKAKHFIEQFILASVLWVQSLDHGSFGQQIIYSQCVEERDVATVLHRKTSLRCAQATPSFTPHLQFFRQPHLKLHWHRVWWQSFKSLGFISGQGNQSKDCFLLRYLMCYCSGYCWQLIAQHWFPLGISLWLKDAALSRLCFCSRGIHNPIAGWFGDTRPSPFASNWNYSLWLFQLQTTP